MKATKPINKNTPFLIIFFLFAAVILPISESDMIKLKRNETATDIVIIHVFNSGAVMISVSPQPPPDPRINATIVDIRSFISVSIS